MVNWDLLTVCPEGTLIKGSSMTLECHKLDDTPVGSKFLHSTKCKVHGNNVHKKHVFTGNCTTRKIFLGKCTNGKNNLGAAIHSVVSV